MARTRIDLPKTVNAKEIRLLWYNLRTLVEIAVNLEEAVAHNKESSKTIPQYQQNILMFIKNFNKQMDQIRYNSQFEHSKIQQYWLNLLINLIRSFKEKEMTEAETKEILKKECIYYFRTDEKDYEELGKDLDNESINYAQYDQLLMEQIIDNEFRKGGDNEKYPHLVNESFKNRDIDKFINEAWNTRLKKNTAQGPVEEARFMLGYILKENITRTKTMPLYFINEEHINEDKVITRLFDEFSIPFMIKIYKEFIKLRLEKKSISSQDGWK